MLPDVGAWRHDACPPVWRSICSIATSYDPAATASRQSEATPVAPDLPRDQTREGVAEAAGGRHLEQFDRAVGQGAGEQ